jgi:type II secretory ATPase GspE/PulE/Tfp pilus assembly ATPase PilB-like protein
MGLRVAVLPTSTGERITMRVLDNKKAAEPLAALGFTEYNLERYRKAFTQPSGLVMITGPTGSGKSTTLYSTFNELLTDSKNFMTAEDPVEYQIQGISQIEVNEDQGMTFAKIMKSFKRSDPNVMLLGEIRDRETAVLGLDIALTGHLLFTTIHADDAPGGISSLIKQDVNPFLVASALDCVVAQRLMRKVCSVCAISYDASQEEIKLLNLKKSIELPGIKKARPGGCEACRYQGYKGRFAVHEVLLMDNELRDLVSRGNATPSELTEQARKGGMEPMLRDGIRRLVSGDTTIDEIARTIKTSQLIDIDT